MTIEQATIARDLDDIIELTVRLVMLPEHHIAFFGATPAEISLCVRKLVDGGASPLVAREDGRIVGMLAVETDSELGRGWFHGPIVDHDDWDSVAGLLYTAAIAELPSTISEFELSCDLRNHRYLEFAARHDYPVRGDWYFLDYARHLHTPDSTSGARPIEEHQHEAVRKLHDTLFPDANTPGSQMIRNQGEHARLLVIGEGADPDGYIYLTVEPESGEAFIDFLGVAEHARGRGIGRRLVKAGADWLFGFPTVEQITLAVRTDNQAAYRLYLNVGFVMERATRGFRKKRMRDEG